MSTKRLRRLLTALATCVVIILVSAQTAQAAPRAVRSSVAGSTSSFVMVGKHRVRFTQTILSMEIQAFARANKLSGYAGAALQTDGATVRLFWAGPVPASLTGWIKTHAPKRVTITKVALSADQLGAEARSITAQAARLGIPVLDAGATSDFSGLQVDVATSATQAQRTILRTLGATEIGVSSARVKLTGRQTDTSPFWGGALIHNSSRGNCSTGFEVSHTNGTTAMVSADHCGTGYTWKTPPGVTVGVSGSGNTSVDAMLLTGQTYGPYIYTGTYTAATERPVYAVYDPELHDPICASGAYSGAVCGTVTKANTYVGGIGPGFIATTSDHTGLAGPGDSGGPVFQNTGNGVLVEGIISSGTTEDTGPCHGVVKRDLPCYWSVFFIYPNAITAALGVSVVAQ